MWSSIQNGPYQRPMVVDPTNPTVPILEPLSKMTKASRAKKAAKNHDPLALFAHSNASSSHSHANSSYSPQPYYVTHPPSVVDYDDEYQGELQGDSQEDKFTTAMMLLARMDGDIQTKNAGYGGNVNKNAGRNITQGFNTGNAAMNDEAGTTLSKEENDFMLDTSYGDDLEELTATVI
ncbi:hypothetical protein Tco_0540998 [Tanacetum coccineum]